MSDLKYSRDLSPQPVTGEFTQPAVPDWVQGTLSRPFVEEPVDKSEAPIIPLQHRVPIRIPERFAYGNISLAGGTAAAQTVVLIPGPLQSGIIRAVNGLISGAYATAQAAVLFSLVSGDNRIILQSTAQIPVAPSGAAGTQQPLALNVWDFDDIYCPFEMGLSMSVGIVGAGANGQFSVNVLWLQ